MLYSESPQPARTSLGNVQSFVYVFNHIPRTGGCGLTQLLTRWLDPVWDYQADGTEAARRHWLSHRIDPRRLRRGQILIGHFGGQGGRLHERYPEVFDPHRYRLLTVLRQPRAWIQSNLRYLCQSVLPSRGLDGTAVSGLQRGMSRAFGIPPLTPATALAPYWVVGTTEKLQVCADLLASLLGHEPRKLDYLNASRPPEPARLQQWREVPEPPATDFALYDQACRRLQEAWVHGQCGNDE